LGASESAEEYSSSASLNLLSVIRASARAAFSCGVEGVVDGPQPTARMTARTKVNRNRVFKGSSRDAE
jgi:hypothetical protein